MHIASQHPILSLLGVGLMVLGILLSTSQKHGRTGVSLMLMSSLFLLWLINYAQDQQQQKNPTSVNVSVYIQGTTREE